MAEKPGGEPGRRSTARSESARLVSKAVGRRGGAMVDMHDGERERGGERRTLALCEAARARFVPSLLADGTTLWPVLAREAGPAMAARGAALAVAAACRRVLDRRQEIEICMHSTRACIHKLVSCADDGKEAKNSRISGADRWRSPWWRWGCR